MITRVSTLGHTRDQARVTVARNAVTRYVITAETQVFPSYSLRLQALEFAIVFLGGRPFSEDDSQCRLFTRDVSHVNPPSIVSAVFLRFRNSMTSLHVHPFPRPSHEARERSPACVPR